MPGLPSISFSGHASYENEWNVQSTPVRRCMICDKFTPYLVNMFGSVLTLKQASILIPHAYFVDIQFNVLIESDCGFNTHQTCRQCLISWVQTYDYIRCPGDCNINFDVRLLASWTGSIFQPHWKRVLPKLTNMEIKQEIKRIKKDTTGTVPCGICSIPLFKTTDCNALLHCQHETCFVCGLTTKKLPGTHWRSSVCSFQDKIEQNPRIYSEGCPRYDHDEFWKDNELDEFSICRVGFCHNTEHDCELLSHKQWREKTNQHRKHFQLYRLYGMIDSFNKFVRYLQKIKNNENKT